MAGKKGQSCVSLLTDNISYEGWQFTLGLKKAFYVRGATWFRTNVLRETTKIGKYIEELPSFEEKIRSTSPDWMIPGFDWSRDFASRQAIDGLSLSKRKPLRFDKAVKTLHFCQVVAQRLKSEGKTDVDSSDVYKKMRIEPAVFYLRDLDSRALKSLEEEVPNVLNDLCEHCAQVHKLVFDDMARGHTVTRKLAERVSDLVTSRKAKVSVGTIEFRHREGLRSASELETLSDDDADSDSDSSGVPSQVRKN